MIYEITVIKDGHKVSETFLAWHTAHEWLNWIQVHKGYKVLSIKEIQVKERA